MVTNLIITASIIVGCFLVSLFVNPRTWFAKTSRSHIYHGFLIGLDGGLTVEAKALIALSENPHLSWSHFVKLAWVGGSCHKEIFEGFARNKNFPIETLPLFPTDDYHSPALDKLKKDLLANPNIPDETKVSLALMMTRA